MSDQEFARWLFRLMAVTLVGGFAAIVASSALRAQSAPPPNPCSLVVFKETEDSLYAELQAPRGTKQCVVEIK